MTCSSFDGIFYKWIASIALFFVMVGVVSWASVYLGYRTAGLNKSGQLEIHTRSDFINKSLISSIATNFADVAGTAIVSPITTIGVEKVTDKSELRQTRSSPESSINDEYPTHSDTLVQSESTKPHENTVLTSIKSAGTAASSTAKNIVAAEIKKSSESTRKKTVTFKPLPSFFSYLQSTKRKKLKRPKPRASTTSKATTLNHEPFRTSLIFTTLVTTPRAEIFIQNLGQILSTYEDIEESKEASTPEIRDISSDRLEAISESPRS